MRRRFALCFIPLFSASSICAEEPFRLTAISSEPVVSARVELLFEERGVNDEGVDIFNGVRAESRESVIHARGGSLWEIEVLLKPEDYHRTPTITCLLTTESGHLLPIPARTLGVGAKKLQSDTSGAVSCLKDPLVLSADEFSRLTHQERVAFVRSREDDSEKLAREVMQLLGEELARRIFDEERRRGLDVTAPLTRRTTVDEIVRRLVALDSAGGPP
jgi:hypothetical protein